MNFQSFVSDLETAVVARKVKPRYAVSPTREDKREVVYATIARSDSPMEMKSIVKVSGMHAKMVQVCVRELIFEGRVIKRPDFPPTYSTVL